MCVIAVLFRYITHAENIQLLLPAMARGINRKQYWPGYEAANETYRGRNFEVSKQKKTIQRLMIQDIAIRNFDKCSYPIE